MKAYCKIEIAMYSRRYGSRKDKQKLIKWLGNVMPFIVRSQSMVTDEIFLKATNQVTGFCLS